MQWITFRNLNIYILNEAELETIHDNYYNLLCSCIGILRNVFVMHIRDIALIYQSTPPNLGFGAIKEKAIVNRIQKGSCV